MSSPKSNNDNINEKLDRDDLQSARDASFMAPAAARGDPPFEGPSAARGSVNSIEEEEPAMRSVAIPAHRRVLHFEPVLKRMETPRLSKQHTVSYGTELISSDLPKTYAPPSKPLTKGWVISEKALTPRPTDLPPLENTSRVISRVNALDLAARITSCLQTRSVKAKYSKTEVLAKCRNREFVKFYVRLFSAEKGILVEVQKIYGDSMSFYRDSRAILDSAEGKSYSSPEEEKPLYLSLPVSQMEFVKEVTLPPLSFEEESASVNIAADLLGSHRSDSNMLGMESLAILTDPLKSLRSTAVIAAKRVLCSEDGANESFNLHNYVMSLVIYGNGCHDASGLEGTAMEDHYLRLRNLAICSVSNAISLLLEEKSLWPSIRSSHKWYIDVLIPSLVRDVHEAEDCPHDACHAISCLAGLASLTESDVFAVKIREAGGILALENAQAVGARDYELLAQVAGKCHQTILQCR